MPAADPAVASTDKHSSTGQGRLSIFTRWVHLPVFVVILLFTIIELGLVASWRDTWRGIHGSYPNRINFMLFVVVWTLLGLVVASFLPFLFVGIWVAFTWLLWLIGASLVSSATCTIFDGRFRLCFGEVGLYQALQAVAWSIWLMFTFIPVAFWWHIFKRNDATLRDGVLGRNYIWKYTPDVNLAQAHRKTATEMKTGPLNPAAATAAPAITPYGSGIVHPSLVHAHQPVLGHGNLTTVPQQSHG